MGDESGHWTARATIGNSSGRRLADFAADV
jgi:hypothetical protein